MDQLLRLAFNKVVKRGQLKVVTSRGVVMDFGDGNGEPVSVRFADAGAQRAFLRDPDMQLGELFMDGRLTIERGTIYDFLYLLLRDSRTQKAPALVRIIDRVRHATRHLKTQNYKSQSKSNVAHHYDLDERLYRLFLDADMQYSCAYFEHEAQSLEDAQRAKKRHIAAKLLVEPNHRVLDIGCGWGGLGLYISEIAGAAHVRGITLSEEQLSVAHARQNKSPRSGNLEFVLQDYRDVAGTFDRIVSVGMFEHVGPAFYAAFFETCHRLLVPDGVMLLHTIGSSDVPGFTMPWLNKYIFPGAYVAALSEIIPTIERAGLIVSDIEVLQLHYAWTLREWRNRFMARRDEAKQLYDERFCRMWEYYLAAGEAAFRCEDVNIFQLQICKSPAVVPATRDYVYQREHFLRKKEQAVLDKAAIVQRSPDHKTMAGASFQ